MHHAASQIQVGSYSYMYGQYVYSVHVGLSVGNFSARGISHGRAALDQADAPALSQSLVAGHSVCCVSERTFIC